MDAPIRLPIRPPIAAPATPAAIRSPVPPPNWDPMKPPVRAPISVPVFSLAPCPVSGVALHAANAVARSTAALRRPIYMRCPPMARNCAASAGDTQCASAGSARELNRENWGKTLAAAVNWRSLTGAAQAKGHHARMNDFKHLFRQLPAIGAVCGERRQRNLVDHLSKRVVDDGVSV